MDDKPENGTDHDAGAAAGVRIDKWLWAARFYKTRSIAADAVTGGRVRINQQRVKPAKNLRPGDVLDIATGEVQRTVIVRALADRRGSAQRAAMLYEETAESLQARERARELRGYANVPGADMQGRPTKRDRRAIERLRRG